jgi:tetratricopeptide (TPR) repeat protein
VRESLGALLQAMGRTQDAEMVFREDLRINPGNPRSLYGLAQCLSAQGKTAEAAKAREQFRKAWRFADAARPRLNFGGGTSPRFARDYARDYARDTMLDREATPRFTPRAACVSSGSRGMPLR